MASSNGPSARLPPHKRVPLHIDPNYVINHRGDDIAVPSPISALSTCSPMTPQLLQAGSSGSENGGDDEKEPILPRRLRSNHGQTEATEKRKRSRVTPEQLAQLERFFATDRSPPATRRKEISDLLGMQERQTQIWYQNRRAKAKLMEGGNKGTKRRSMTLTSPLSTDSPALLDDELVISVPCSDLAIGSWRRIATPEKQGEIMAYCSTETRNLTWYVQSDGSGFKMEIPFDTVIDVEYANTTPGSGLASFELSRPPYFFLEDKVQDATATSKHWKRCTDWTEGLQATHILRHDVIALAAPFSRIVQKIRNELDSRIQTPVQVEQLDASSPAMQIPQPPLAGLPIADFFFEDSPDTNLDTSISHHSPTTSTSDFTFNAGPSGPHSAPAVMSYAVPMPKRQNIFDFHDYPQMKSTFGEFGLNIPNPQGLASRSFSASALQSAFMPNEMHLPLGGMVAEDMSTYPTFGALPQPSLLTTPYLPPHHMIEEMDYEHIPSSTSPPYAEHQHA